MATQPILNESQAINPALISDSPSVTKSRHSGQFGERDASEAGKKGAESKKLKAKGLGDTKVLVRKVLIQALHKGDVRAALALNAELGVMRSDQKDAADEALAAGAALLSSTAPEPTKYLTSEQVERIRAIGSDKQHTVPSRKETFTQQEAGNADECAAVHTGVVADDRLGAVGIKSTETAIDHPSSQKAAGTSGIVTSSPKFFSDSVHKSLEEKVDMLTAQISELASALLTLAGRMK